MSLLIESIKLHNGKFYNLFYHEQRMRRSLYELWRTKIDLNLEEFLSDMNYPVNGLFKCRIVYSNFLREVQFLAYTPKVISSLKIIESDQIHYRFKFQNRNDIERLFQLRDTCDDILIVQNGKVTDSSFSNIVFRKDNCWITPKAALLRGTQRQKLIDENKIVEEKITLEDIRSFDTFKLINAMLEFNGPEIPVVNIIK
jgi:4-amino-4-deoxychorismate lyase